MLVDLQKHTKNNLLRTFFASWFFSYITNSLQYGRFFVVIILAPSKKPQKQNRKKHIKSYKNNKTVIFNIFHGI